MLRKFFIFSFAVALVFSVVKLGVSQPTAVTENKIETPPQNAVESPSSDEKTDEIAPEETDEGAQKEAVPAEKTAAQKTADSDLYSQIELFSYALTTIQSEYVDEPTAKDLIYGSLKGMLSSLDPHSQFLEPEDYKELKTETQGKFGGLGIEISIRDGLLTVVTPLEDTPAWKVGIQPGDRIVKIGDELTKDMTLSDAVKKMRGKPGTDIKITVLREDELKIHDYTITREIIHVQDVKDVQILQDKIGYIRLTEFREDSFKEFHKALHDLESQGADSLILDLRNNPGGLLNVAIDIAAEFLSDGKVIVTTKARNPAQNTEAKSHNKDKDFDNWPMVVLINEGSASGSEIVAGALQDHKRAVIVGTKSFGKGSVQSVIPLPDGSGLRLTTSKYFTPSGRSIHGIGIEPDVEIKREIKKKEDAPTAEEQSIEEIFNNVKSHEPKKPEEATQNKDQNEPKPQNKELTESQKKLKEDNQVQSAINIIKGIKTFRKSL